MKIEIHLDREESKQTNIGFVEAMMKSGCFTIDDLREICAYLYVVSFMFGSKNKGENE